MKNLKWTRIMAVAAVLAWLAAGCSRSNEAQEHEHAEAGHGPKGSERTEETLFEGRASRCGHWWCQEKIFLQNALICAVDTAPINGISQDAR